MKKILSILAVVLLAAVGAYGQSPSPGIFNYQGVARNSVGNVLVNKTITLRLTIHDGAAAGPTVYQESRTAVTNPFGLFNVQVGSPGASAVTGTIAGVNWGVNTKFIQVEIDPNGGTTFINIGTAQIASVPYALYASLANDLVLPFIKTQAAVGSTLIGLTNSATTGVQGAFTGTSASTDGNAYAITGTISSTSPGGFSSGVRGINNGTGGLGIGVYGSQNGSGWGVYGTTPSGIGVNGTTTSGTGVSGSSTSGIGVNGSSTSGTGGRFTTTSGLALHTTGGVRLQGINEALNRILASDATGNATWQNPAAVGIVTGSGTLNFVPKWTPNGTNLGNSELFDNGTLVGLGTVTPFNTQLHIASDGNGSNGFAGTRYTNPTSAAAFGGLYVGLNFATGSQEVYMGTNEAADMGFYTSGANRLNMTASGNIGIGVVAPAARLQVDNAGTNGSVLVNHSNAANITRGMTVLSANTSAVGFGNSAIYGQRGTPGAGNFLFINQPTATTGISGGAAGIGVQGSGNTIGTVGVTNTGIGVLAYAVDPTGFGLVTNGRVQIAGQNAGLNRVLTSDATGNATWQTLGAGVGVGGSGTLNYVSKWTPNGTNLGNSIMFDDGTAVGVGTTTPTHRFEVNHGGANGIAVRSTASFSVVDIDANNGDAALRFQKAGAGQWNMRNRPADDYLEIFELGGGGSRMVIQDATGNVGIGETTNPTYRLDVLHGGSTGIRSRSSASFSVVDIDAASGDAALRFQKAGVGQWNTRNRPADDYYEIFELGGGGSRMVIQDATGNVGIGETTNPTYKLDVLHGGSTGIRSRSSGSFSVVDIDAASGDAALRFANAGVNQWNIRNRPADDYLEIFELGGGGSRMVIQDATGNVGIGQTTNPTYKLDVLHGGATGLRVQSSATFSVIDIDGQNGDAALRFVKAGVNQWNTRNNPATDDYQIFELGGGGERMRIDNTTGKVWVNQDFTVVGVKAFTMDHPLDPENKLLMHAAAESNEVINFYSGNVVTDASGKAVVSLPDYYEALNKDSRYQLTVIGSFAQAIISKEVSNNKFEIATSVPNVKVSWEVKGVRNDARMKKHPFVAEEMKSAAQRGKYVDPESHNQPTSKGVSYDANLGSSLSDIKPSADKKVAPPTTGGSLDQAPIVPPSTAKADNSGSVAPTEVKKVAVKAVDNSGSVAPAEATKQAPKKVTEPAVNSTNIDVITPKAEKVPVNDTKKQPVMQETEVAPALPHGVKLTVAPAEVKPAEQKAESNQPSGNSPNAAKTKTN